MNAYKIVRFLETARQHLKYPKIRLTAGGDPLHFQLAGDRAKIPGSVNITDGAGYPDNVWYGRIMPDGDLQLSRSATDTVKRVVEALAKDPEHTVAAYGRRFGICSCCGRELTDERSVSKGYGPVCAEHWGLPWGDRPAVEFHEVEVRDRGNEDRYTGASKHIVPRPRPAPNSCTRCGRDMWLAGQLCEHCVEDDTDARINREFDELLTDAS